MTEPNIISRSEGHIFKTFFTSRKKILNNIAKIIGYDKYGCKECDISSRDSNVDGYHDEKLKKRLREGFSLRKPFNSSCDSIFTDYSV